MYDIEKIRTAIERGYMISWEHVTSSNRQRHLVTLRTIAVYYLKTHANMREAEIGELLHKDRVTVIHMYKNANTYLQTQDDHFCTHFKRMNDFLTCLNVLDELKLKIEGVTKWLAENTNNPQFKIIQSDKHHFMERLQHVQATLNDLTLK